MADKSKALYHSGIGTADSEKPTADKAKAEKLRRVYDEKIRKEDEEREKKLKSLPRADGTFRMSVGDALKKTSKK